MTTGVGDGVARAATPQAPARTWDPWRPRLLVAFGGALVATVANVLWSAWSTGLRPSTFEQLRADLGDGVVQQWYVAQRLEPLPF